jgi:hypothetical protein
LQSRLLEDYVPKDLALIVCAYASPFPVEQEFHTAIQKQIERNRAAGEDAKQAQKASHQLVLVLEEKDVSEEVQERNGLCHVCMYQNRLGTHVCEVCSSAL